MKDQLITFETAKLAKEKGFNWKNIEILEVKSKSAFLDSTTQSLLQKWLREVHNINVYVLPLILFKELQYQPFKNVGIAVTGNMGGYFMFDNYEKALELGLQEGLKLIK